MIWDHVPNQRVTYDLVIPTLSTWAIGYEIKSSDMWRICVGVPFVTKMWDGTIRIVSHVTPSHNLLDVHEDLKRLPAFTGTTCLALKDLHCAVGPDYNLEIGCLYSRHPITLLRDLGTNLEQEGGVWCSRSIGFAGVVNALAQTMCCGYTCRVHIGDVVFGLCKYPDTIEVSFALESSDDKWSLRIGYKADTVDFNSLCPLI